MARNTLAGKSTGKSKSAKGTKYTKKYNFTYQTKCLITGKTYVGVHCTDDLNDGYIGCGIYNQGYVDLYSRTGAGNSAFRRAVVKYGYENFKLEYLAFFDTMEEAYEEEAILVDEAWVKSQDNYNVSLGGFGGKTTKKHVDKYENIRQDFLGGMLVRDLQTKYKVCNAIVAEALRGVDKSKRDWDKVFMDKYSDVSGKVYEMYSTGSSKSEICRELGIDIKTCSKIIKITDCKQPVKYYVALRGDQVEIFSDMNKFAKEHGLFTSGIRQSLKGAITNYKGWRFFTKEVYDSGNIEIKESVKDKHKGLKIVNPSGEVEVVTTTLKDFCRERGLSASGFYRAFKDPQKHNKGYRLWQETH